MKFHECCPLCGNKDTKPLKDFVSYDLCRCQVCKLVYERRVPSEQELYDHDKQYSYSALKQCPLATVHSYNRLLDEFEIYRQTGNILDVGCGQGDFLNEAKKRGWVVYGSEYSRAAIKLCRDRGLNTQEGELSDNMYEAHFFDVVTSFEVVEHISNHDEHLSSIYRILRKGGLFYCTTPNFNALLRYTEKNSFRMLSYPEHISFFTKSSLRYLARKNNFNLQKIMTTGLDLRRLKANFRSGVSGENVQGFVERKAQVDGLRLKIEQNIWLAMTKNVVNASLTITGTGDTLKAYLVK